MTDGKSGCFISLSQSGKKKGEVADFPLTRDGSYYGPQVINMCFVKALSVLLQVVHALTAVVQPGFKGVFVNQISNTTFKLTVAFLIVELLQPQYFFVT